VTHPDAIIVRERRCEAPTRRLVYHALETGGYERQTQLWREAVDGWHTAGTEVVTALTVTRDGVEASEYGQVGGSGSLAITTE